MIQKSAKFLNEKNVKITKWAHPFKGFWSSYNGEILNSFNTDLQLKDTESEIKSKLIELLAQLKAFKFVTTLVLVFKKIESQFKESMTVFTHTQKQKQLSMKVTLMVCFNQSILQLYQTLKNL